MLGDTPAFVIQQFPVTQQLPLAQQLPEVLQLPVAQQLPPTSAPGLFTIGANCIATICDEFFLLIEIENNVMGAEEVSPTIFIRLTDAQAMALMNAGVSACQITDVPPTPIPGLTVEFKCFVILNGQAFQVFDIEDSIDVEVLVRTRSCPVINEPFTAM